MQMILVNTENTFISLLLYNIKIACNTRNDDRCKKPQDSRNVLNTERNFRLEIFHDGACC